MQTSMNPQSRGRARPSWKCTEWVFAAQMFPVISGKMPFFTYPVIPGHELGVQVVAVGEGVENVQPGDRCSIEPYMDCGDCYACLKGATNCCESLEVIGVHKNGGMCERFLLPARKLHPSAKITMEQLALVETLAIGCHCVNRADTQANDKVLVIGAGQSAWRPLNS